MANPLSQDDSTIDDLDALWRRIHPNWWIPDQNGGGKRLTSAAFQNSKNTNSCSVLLEKEMRINGRSIQDALAKRDGYGMAKILAGQARASSDPPQVLVRESTVADPEHANIVGEKRKPAQRVLREAAIMLLEPSIPT